MLGRAVFGNPWLFDRKKRGVTVREKLEVAVEHTKLFEETWRDTKSFDLMKKHYQAYVNHFPLAKEVRVALMSCRSAEEVRMVIEKFLKTHSDIAAHTLL